LTQEQHFDEVAAEYDESLPKHVVEHLRGRRERLALSLVPKGRLLDVGCGTGVFLEAMPAASYECVGVDVSEAMVDHARARGLDVTKAPADELPFETGSFDLVTCVAVLHHLIDPDLVDRSVREMARVVRPGGAVMIWDHNPLNPYWPLLMRRLPQDRGDERLVPAKQIVSPLRSAGMEDIVLRRMTFVPDFTPAGALATAARVERVLERVPLVRNLGAHNVVTAFKPR
jgi:SAM-dependent methyltransferase